MAVRVSMVVPRCLRRLFSTASTSSSILAPPPALEPSTSLFVTGLSKRTGTERLREAFSQFGVVVHARVMIDRLSGISKGFGYVKYTTTEEAAKGIEGMDGKFLDGWIIFAEYARQRPQRRPPPQPVNHGHEARTHARHGSYMQQKDLGRSIQNRSKPKKN